MSSLSSLGQQHFKRILIIKPSALGDLVHALPVLYGLRQRYPTSHIAWLVNNEYQVLLEQQKQLNEVIPFDRKSFRSLGGTIKATSHVWALWRRLRRSEFDLAIDLQGLFRSGLMSYASHAPVRLGFKPAREGAGIFYTHRIPIPDRQEHAVDKNYRVAELLAFQDVPVAFHLPVPGAVEDIVRQELEDANVTVGEYCLVFPGSRWETKNWWPARYAQTIDHVQDSIRCRVVLGGSQAEKRLCEEISSVCRTPPVNWTGKTDLLKLIALIRHSRMVLCNDSAAMHLAAALKKPLVAVFGPTHPGRSGPYAQRESVVQAKLPCVPCYFRVLRKCPIEHECMNQITVEGVCQKLEQCLSIPA